MRKSHRWTVPLAALENRDEDKTLRARMSCWVGVARLASVSVRYYKTVICDSRYEVAKYGRRSNCRDPRPIFFDEGQAVSFLPTKGPQGLKLAHLDHTTLMTCKERIVSRGESEHGVVL